MAGLQRLSEITLVSGQVGPSNSPCGPNCSYTTVYEGPRFKCGRYIRNETVPLDPRTSYEYYSGAWSPLAQNDSMSVFLTLNLTYYLGQYRPDPSTIAGLMLREVHSLGCQPARAQYQTMIEYQNGVRQITTHVSNIRDLSDRDTTTLNKRDPVLPSNVTDEIEVMNIYSILDSVVEVLAGTYDMMGLAPHAGDEFPFTMPNGTTFNFTTLTTPNDDSTNPLSQALSLLGVKGA